MNVLVVGGTGFIGRHLCEELVDRGHDVTALSRNPDQRSLPTGVNAVRGDVTEYSTIEPYFEDVDGVVNLVGLSPLFEPRGGTEMYDRVIRQGTENVVRAAVEGNTDRLLQQSQLGADPNAQTAFLRAKGRADEIVQESSLEWTITRPSVVFGDGDEFVGFTKLLTTPYVTWLPGGGTTLQVQPIWVEDLSELLANALEGDEHVGEIYEIGGPDVLTLADVARLAHRADGRSLRILPLPMLFPKIALTVADPIPFIPFGRDQYRGLTFQNTTDGTDVERLGMSHDELTSLAAYLDSRSSS